MDDHTIIIPGELWESFKAAADIGHREGEHADHDRLAFVYIEQAFHQYIALKLQIQKAADLKKKRKQS